MTACFAQVLRRYGQQVTVETRASRLETRAFLQPVNQKNKAAPFAVTPLGAVDDRLWICLGLTALSPGDRVCWGERRFSVRDSRPWYVGEELSHWWAVLSLEKEAAK